MYSKEHKVLRPYLNLIRADICDPVLKQPHKIYVGYLWNHWYVFIIRIGLKVCTMTREEKKDMLLSALGTEICSQDLSLTPPSQIGSFGFPVGICSQIDPQVLFGGFPV